VKSGVAIVLRVDIATNNLAPAGWQKKLKEFAEPERIGLENLFHLPLASVG
jgi:hypothetical protein